MTNIVKIPYNLNLQNLLSVIVKSTDRAWGVWGEGRMENSVDPDESSLFAKALPKFLGQRWYY